MLKYPTQFDLATDKELLDDLESVVSNYIVTVGDVLPGVRIVSN